LGLVGIVRKKNPSLRRRSWRMTRYPVTVDSGARGCWVFAPFRDLEGNRSVSPVKTRNSLSRQVRCLVIPGFVDIGERNDSAAETREAAGRGQLLPRNDQACRRDYSDRPRKKTNCLTPLLMIWNLMPRFSP
jgi:hypothetical protein